MATGPGCSARGSLAWATLLVVGLAAEVGLSSAEQPCFVAPLFGLDIVGMSTVVFVFSL